MDYVEITNENNKVIINDSYKNLFLLEKGHCKKLKSYKDAYGGRIPYDSWEQYFQYKSSLYQCSCIAFMYNNSNEMVEVSSILPYGEKTTGGGYVVLMGADKSVKEEELEVFIYGYQEPKPSKNGLTIYNKEGKVVFSSDEKYLNLVDFVILDNRNGVYSKLGNNKKVYMTKYNNVKKLGLYGYNMEWEFDPEGSEYTAVYILGPKNSYVKVDGYWDNWPSDDPTLSPEYRNPPFIHILLADVTNH